MLKKSLMVSLGLIGFATPLLATNIVDSNLILKNTNNINAENKINKDAKQEPTIVSWNAFDTTATSTGLLWRIISNGELILNTYIQVLDSEGHVYYEQGGIQDLTGTTRIRGLKSGTYISATIGVEYFDFASGNIEEVNQTDTFLTSDVPYSNFHYGSSKINNVARTSFEMTIYSSDNYDGSLYSRLIIIDPKAGNLDFDLIDYGWNNPSVQTDFGYFWTINVINLNPDTTYNLDLVFNSKLLFNIHEVHTLA